MNFRDDENGGSPQGGLSETDSQSPFGLLTTSILYMIWEGRGMEVDRMPKWLWNKLSDKP